MRLERLLELLEAERIERRGDVGVSYARASLLSNTHSRLAYDQADELSRAPLDNRDGFICDCILLTAHRALHYVPNGRDREQRWLGYDGRRRRGRRQLVLTGRFGDLLAAHQLRALLVGLGRRRLLISSLRRRKPFRGKQRRFAGRGS